MDIRYDKNNPIPIGIQVKEQIKMLVDSGSYKAGDKLPSINSLASFIGVNKNTIVTIIKDLENEGYVYTHRGKGIFVRQGRKKGAIGIDFVGKVDAIIQEAQSRDINVNELINLISARFVNMHESIPFNGNEQHIKALFLMGIGKELIEINLLKLRENLPEVEFEGLFLTKDFASEKTKEAYDWADVLIVPSIVYDIVGHSLPKDKPVIKTMANLKLLGKLKKGIEKKSSVAIIGQTQKGARILADMFISARLFRSKLVIGIEDIEENKKLLKEIDSVVVCESAKNAVDKLKLKDKEIYYFSDYIDDESMLEIKHFISRFGGI